MNDIVFFENSMPRIGLKVRKPKPGPELDLVKGFVNFELDKFVSRKRSNNLAVFFEPLLDTGFPDIVFIEYDLKSYQDWTDNRCDLKASDLKLFLHILQSNGTDSESIERELGLNSKIILRTLERLLDCGLIKRSAQKWKVLNFKRSFGIKSIVSVEAKMNNWTTAFEQASLNKWFSSESYVLSSVNRPSEKILRQAENLGVGIYLSNTGGIKKVRHAVKGVFPACYGSLLFNEWIGKYLSTKC